VLIEQITDIRSGRRVNPKMAPFSDEHVLNIAEIADIAAYLQALPIRNIESGKGTGKALDQGKTLYTRDCVVCHGDRAEGNARKFIPLLAGQHYAYLLREGGLIRDEKRGNANPDMVKTIKSYSDGDLDAVSDYISRLVVP
jgi:cytochrome c553